MTTDDLMRQIQEMERLIVVYRNANEVIVGTPYEVYASRGLVNRTTLTAAENIGNWAIILKNHTWPRREGGRLGGGISAKRNMISAAFAMEPPGLVQMPKIATAAAARIVVGALQPRPGVSFGQKLLPGRQAVSPIKTLCRQVPSVCIVAAGFRAGGAQPASCESL
jgi:hypothetical protein